MYVNYLSSNLKAQVGYQFDLRVALREVAARSYFLLSTAKSANPVEEEVRFKIEVRRLAAVDGRSSTSDVSTAVRGRQNTPRNRSAV